MKKTGFYKNCERCIKPFWCYAYNYEARRFCSTVCSNKSTAAAQSKTKRARAKKITGNQRWRYNVLYIDWRNQCLARDNFTCQNCGIKLTNTTAIVHHPKSWKEYPELRYEVSNGMSVCRKCHNIVDKDLGRGRYGYK